MIEKLIDIKNSFVEKFIAFKDKLIELKDKLVERFSALKDKLSELYGAENIEDDSTNTVSQGPFAEAYAEDIRVRNEGNL